MAVRPRRARGRGGRLLAFLILLLAVGALLFFWLGGSFDFDADVNAPNVEVDPGSVDLPEVQVSPAPPADAER